MTAPRGRQQAPIAATVSNVLRLRNCAPILSQRSACNPHLFAAN